MHSVACVRAQLVGICDSARAHYGLTESIVPERESSSAI